MDGPPDDHGFTMVSNGMENEQSENGEPTLREKVAYLSSPEAYPSAKTVTVKETRMAWVFLAGDHVYKMKKPVLYPYLDYSTLEARQRVCEEEVRLNRRLAPDVYLGVARLTRESKRGLVIDGQGDVVDWLVEMRRLPHALFLDNAIHKGAVSVTAIKTFAERLVQFYSDAASIALNPAERVAALDAQLEQGLEVLGQERFASLAAARAGILDSLKDILRCCPELVSERVEAGRIVEGHGDLRPEHVCLTDPPVIIDCLEFSRQLRLVDPFDELSFLTMECDALGARWLGPLLIDRVASGLNDHPPEHVLAFYRAYRAALRARQALEHLLESDPRTPEKWWPKAEAYFDEAERALVSLRRRATRAGSRPGGGGG